MRPVGFPFGRFIIVVMLAFATASAVSVSAPSVQAHSAAPERVQPAVTSATPITDLVTEPYDHWTIGAGMLYWGRCEVIPGLPQHGPKVTPETSSTQGYLRRTPTHGGTVATLSTSAFCDQYMAADDSGLYSWDGTSIQKRPIDTPDKPVAIYTPSGYSSKFNQPPVTRLLPDGNYLYWASGAKIVRLAKDGSNIAVLADVGSNPNSVVSAGKYLGWLDDRGLWQVDPTCPGQPCGEQQLETTKGGSLLYDPHRSVGFSFLTTYYWVNGPNLYGHTCRIDQFPTKCFVQTFYTASAADTTLGSPGSDGKSLFWPENIRVCDSNMFCDYTNQIRRMAFTSNTPDTIADSINGFHASLLTDDLGVYFEDPNIGRLPFNAAPIIRDLRPDAWEVTQGIQSLQNDVPLVATKPTYVRVYAKEFSGPAANTVEAVLQGSANGNALPNSPLQPLNNARPLHTNGTYNRGNLDDSWLFQLPAEWIGAGTIALNVVVDPRNLYTKPTPPANQLGGTFSFTAKAPVCTVFIPVRTNAPPASTGDPNFWTMIDRFKTLWPVPDVWAYHQDDDIAKLEIKWGGPFDLIPYPGYGPYEIPDNNNRIITSMIERDILSDDPDRCDNANARTHYVGMVHPDTDTGTNNGFANYAFAASWVKLPPHDTPPPVGSGVPRAGAVMAQEMSHNYNGVFGDRWKHVNCGGPDGLNPNYPYNPCTLDDKALTDPATHWGFDILTQTPIQPDTTADYMSYGSTKWVSDYSWKGMFNETKNGAPATAPQQPVLSTTQSTNLAAGSTVALATGIITPSVNQAQLYPLLVLPTTAVSPGMLRKWQQFVPDSRPQAVDAAHTYHLQLRGTDGAVLSDQPVTLNPNDDDGPGQSGGFTLAWTPPAGTVARVDLLDGTTVLTSINPGISNPTITLLQPSGGPTVADKMTVAWRASDADKHDRLFFTVQYSPDLGKTWRALITNLPATGLSDTTTLQLDHLSGIPGSTTGALIRVAASDGYHTALATSQPFTVTNRPPEPHIGAPTNNQTVVAGQNVILHGGASDAEDGGLSGAALQWMVDSKPVGTGADQHVGGLAPGVHDVALTARDSASQERTVHATVRVNAVHVPLATEPALDGNCDDPSYATSTALALAPYSDGSRATAHLLRTPSDLWVCFSGLARTTGGPGDAVGIRVDVNNSRDATVQPDDAAFFVGENGTPNVGIDRLHTATSATGVSWNAELRIPASAVGGFNHLVGIDLAQHWVRFTGDDYHWPYNAIYDQPQSWALTALGDVPSITSLSTDHATAGDPALTLAITGTNFLSGATVRWNGGSRPTTFVDPSHLTVQVSSGDLATAGTAAITVVNADFPTAPSNPVSFMIQNPVPHLTTLVPPGALAGSGALTLTVNGSRFQNGANVLWNGKFVPTHFVSATKLEATISADQLAPSQTVSVAVVNPEPDAGTSNTLPFSIAAPSPDFRVLLPLIVR